MASEICWKAPVVIICDRTTSGSAEVFAAAIADYQRGLLIGDVSTNGRGTVQNVCDVSDGFLQTRYGAVKFTAGALFRVTGSSIQRDGAASDIILPSLSSYLNPSEQSLENSLSIDPIPPAKYAPFETYVSDSIVADISMSSKARLLANSGFKIVNDLKQRHVKRTNETTVSLRQTDTEARQGSWRAIAERVVLPKGWCYRTNRCIYLFPSAPMTHAAPA